MISIGKMGNNLYGIGKGKTIAPERLTSHLPAKIDVLPVNAINIYYYNT